MLYYRLCDKSFDDHSNLQRLRTHLRHYDEKNLAIVLMCQQVVIFIKFVSTKIELFQLKKEREM